MVVRRNTARIAELDEQPSCYENISENRPFRKFFIDFLDCSFQICPNASYNIEIIFSGYDFRLVWGKYTEKGASSWNKSS